MSYDAYLNPCLIQATSERSGKEDIARKKHVTLKPFHRLVLKRHLAAPRGFQ